MPAKKAEPKVKKAPQDLTDYNLRGMRTDLTELAALVTALASRVVALENPAPIEPPPAQPEPEPASGEGGDDLGHD